MTILANHHYDPSCSQKIACLRPAFCIGWLMSIVDPKKSPLHRTDYTKYYLPMTDLIAPHLKQRIC